MEPLILIVGLFLLFWFKKSIKGVAGTAEVLVDVTNSTSEDSLRTYANEVGIMNLEKRNDQLKRIQGLEARVTNDDIEALLKASNAQPAKPAAKAKS